MDLVAIIVVVALRLMRVMIVAIIAMAIADNKNAARSKKKDQRGGGEEFLHWSISVQGEWPAAQAMTLPSSAAASRSAKPYAADPRVCAANA